MDAAPGAIQCGLGTEKGVGISLRNFSKEVVDATRKMLDPIQHAMFAKRVREMKNRAVFEIPEILDRILDSHR